MVYRYEINNLPMETGDLICTVDGTITGTDIKGQFWRLLGKIIPGDVDHIVIYVGPEGRCVEAGARGEVIIFKIENHTWDADKMVDFRGMIDTLYGVAYPLQEIPRTQDEITEIRESVAEYCLRQAVLNKPYNLNFLDSSTENAFYCSQLAYKAYLKNDIDLNTQQGVPQIPATESIIFPQEIWSGCYHKRHNAILP